MANTSSGNNSHQQVVVNISANTQGVQQGVQQAQQSLQSLGNTNINTSSISSLRQQLRDATNEALRLQQAGQINTDAYRNATRTIADLRDQQDLLNRTVSAFDPGNKFNAFIGIAQSAANGVQGIAGALTVLGVNSETANEAIARLQGIMAMTDAINAIGDLQDYWKGWLLTLTNGTTAAQANTTATNAQTVAQTANATATTGATVATKALGVALKSIGIGLIVAAVAYLVSNWKELKKSVTDLFPSLETAGETFNKIKNIVFGVGNAVVQFLIAPIKSVIALLQGDFKKSIDEMRKGADVVNNFKQGQRSGELRDEDAHRKELIKKQIEATQDDIDRKKAAGKETYDLEQQNRRRQLQLVEQDSDERKTIQKEIELEEIRHNTKLQDERDKAAKTAADKASQARKAAHEKAVAERKANDEEVKKLNEEATKLINQYNMNARQKDLDNLETEFNKKKAIYEKYGNDISKLTESYNLQRADIEKKYDQEVDAYINASNTERLGIYEKMRLEVNKKYEEASKNAVDNQIETLAILRDGALSEIDKIQSLDNTSVSSQVNLIKTTSEQTVSDEDTPETRYEKVLAVLEAERLAEVDAFNLKKEQLQGQNEELQLLEADHNAKLLDIQRKRVEADKALDDAQYGYKVDTLNKVGTAVANLGQLIGENTVAGKALAIGQATINTFLGATEVLRNPTTIPEPYGTIAKVASMASVIATGLATVKKIAAVQINGKKGGGGAGNISAPTSLSTVTAPTVSANSLNQSTQTQDVRVTNPESMTVRAYIVDKDLKDNEDRTNFMNNLSTL